MGFIVASLLGTGALAQNVNYKVLKDNPADVANFFVNVELLEFELPIKNIKGTSFCLGLNSYANYNNKFGAEIAFRRGYLNLGGTARTQFELGGFFNFKSKVKVRNQKVVLDSKEWTTNSTTYTETKFIKCPAQNLRSLGVRGGFLTNKEAYEDESGALTGTYRYGWTGVYAGILLTSQMNYRINSDQFGEAGAGFIRRYYADVLIHPFASLTDIENDKKATNASIGRLGFRLGLEAMPAERRKMGQAPVYFKIEVGMRPLDGIYMMGSFGVSIKRKLPKLGIQETKRETE